MGGVGFIVTENILFLKWVSEVLFYRGDFFSHEMVDILTSVRFNRGYDLTKRFLLIEYTFNRLSNDDLITVIGS